MCKHSVANGESAANRPDLTHLRRSISLSDVEKVFDSVALAVATEKDCRSVGSTTLSFILLLRFRALVRN